MARTIRDKFTEQLFEAILLLESKEECYNFFQDIATIGEIKALGQRLEVARMLKEGYTYDHIVDETGVSTATISRVKRSLEYGEDGYNLILTRLEEMEAAE
ncbi:MULTISPECIES: YerC/YecD family TrpR-related protein [Halanaerobium]|uniref:Trp operon repressor family n=1 Tax=Halanaerobium congolense TaxID=54121 RepID=A0A4R7E1W2_9FIRM|nr:MULTISPECIES: YerC/YecD family TrpR-related protein [Halanaerobium]PUU87969.1 MAG: TrpR-like protein YerC/YecD [Halanaerobium sp.]TDS27735.1 Trp operon repressor family [Halanaerobium congolense]